MISSERGGFGSGGLVLLGSAWRKVKCQNQKSCGVEAGINCKGKG